MISRIGKVLDAIDPKQIKLAVVGWAECNEAQQFGASMRWASYPSPTYEPILVIIL